MLGLKLRSRAIGPIGVGLLMIAKPAAAQNPEQADAKFKEGMAKLDAGDTAAACPLLEESLKLDYGMATEFRLAECYEKLGKTASAQATFRRVAEKASAQGMDDRAKVASDRADALNTKVTRLAIVYGENAEDATVQITLDGTALPDRDWRKATPLDPGEVHIVARAPGMHSFDHKLSLKTPGTTERVTVNLVPETEAAPPPTDATTTSSDGMSTQAMVGLIVGGVGVLALGGGVALGFAAKSKHDDSAPFCNANQCEDEGISIRDDARTLGTVGTIVFIGGAALAAGGAVLWLTAPSGDNSVGLVPNPGGLSLVGSF